MEFCNSRITFKRGDDDTMMVALANGVTFSTGDKVFFSLKLNASGLTDIFQIEATEFVKYDDVEDAAVLITIPHENTIDLALGKYLYDILIEWADGTYVTVIPPTRFKLVAGGSHDDSG